MANINKELTDILRAIYGREVRGSIHDAIDKINKVNEVAVDCGTDIENGDAGPLNPDGSRNSNYDKAIYINTDTYDVLVCDSTTWLWTAIGNIIGNGIDSITGPVVDPSAPLVDNYTINFTKDPTPKLFSVVNGKGIVSIAKTSTAGLIDTYTITWNNGTTSTYNIVNGKDGSTTLHGTEISGKAAASTGYTLATDDCKAGDYYFQQVEGAFYYCDVGAEHGNQSYWSCIFVMSGGGGGVNYLYLLQDVDQASVQSPTNGMILQYDATSRKWKAAAGGNGHVMLPTPASTVDEDDVVDAITDASVDGENINVASLYGIQRWTNKKTFRIVCTSGIGHFGIGEWQYTLDNPSASDEAGWGWWHHDMLKKLGDLTQQGYDIDIKIKYDPAKSDPITLGGYQLDTTAGYICIRFANYVNDIANAVLAVDITLTRTDVLTV